MLQFGVKATLVIEETTFILSSMTDYAIKVLILHIPRTNKRWCLDLSIPPFRYFNLCKDPWMKNLGEMSGKTTGTELTLDLRISEANAEVQKIIYYNL